MDLKGISEKYAVLFQYLQGKLPEEIDTVIVTGGRGSGKSWVVAALSCLALAIFINLRILYTRYTLTSAGLSIVPEFIKKIKILGLQDEIYPVFRDHVHQVVAESNDSALYFAGIKTGGKEQTANLKSLEGVSLWVLDEAEEQIYEHIFDKIQFSVRAAAHHNLSIMVLNPTHKQHFIFRRFFKGMGVKPGFNGIMENVLYIHTDYRDNIKNLPKSIVRGYERLRLRDPKKYNHVVLGGWLDQAEGLIYPEWQVLDKRPANLRLIVKGLDYGFANDPSALVDIYQVQGEKDTLFFETVFCETGLFNKDLAGLITSAPNYRRSTYIAADSNEAKTNADLQDNYKINVIATKKGAGSVMAGINKMKRFTLCSMTGDPISSEAVEYAWEEKKDGSEERENTPLKANDHCMDAARYGVNLMF